MNQIPQRQNQDQFLQYLAAQRQLYDEEKSWLALWTIAATVIAVLGTGMIALAAAFTHYITLASVAVMVGEFLLLGLIRKKRELAAKIQELFDCELLELPWNDIVAGAKPEPEEIAEAQTRFLKRRDPQEWEALKNWYAPTVGQLPLYDARLACQRENLWWDAELRRLYARWVLAATISIILTLVAIGITKKWEMAYFFQGPLPLNLPILVFGFLHYHNHMKAATRLDELRAQMNALQEQSSLSESNVAELTKYAREFQNEIFHHRTENAPVFSWFYNFLKEKFEARVHDSVKRQ